MSYFVLTVFLAFANAQPVVASNVFPDITSCQIEEGRFLTLAAADDKVTGWHIVDDCTSIAKVTKG